VTALSCRVVTLTVEKAGNRAGQSDDAAWPAPAAYPRDLLEPQVRLALADGATESYLAGQWAQVLVGQVGADKRARVVDAVQSARRRWTGLVADYVADRVKTSRPLQWYEEPAIERGAGATLLVVDLHFPGEQARPAKWKACAIGDSCVFIAREGRLARRFPMMASADFGTRPTLVSSLQTDPLMLIKHMRHAHGTCLPGDNMLLMTDALAQWLLDRPHHRRARVGACLRWLEEAQPDAFLTWITELREADDLRNDDTTLILVSIG
jgi:hypothetical protein